MRRDELDELHYITPISNIPSICGLGILSHRRAASVDHDSIAMLQIQDRRANVEVPEGRPLHEYVNLYICARNPMMYKRRSRHAELSVLRVSADVLDLPGVVVTDANASSSYRRFAAAPRGLSTVDRELTFADDWRDNDYFEYLRKKSAKCAEVLVPNCVPPRFLMGAYVSCEDARDLLDALGVSLATTINSHLFFR